MKKGFVEKNRSPISRFLGTLFFIMVVVCFILKKFFFANCLENTIYFVVLLSLLLIICLFLIASIWQGERDKAQKKNAAQYIGAIVLSLVSAGLLYLIIMYIGKILFT